MRHIIGITRFGLLGPMGEGQFHFPPRKKPAILTKQQWMLSPGYLAHRLALWSAFAGPTVDALVNHTPLGCGYTHLVAVNPELPNLAALGDSLPPNTILAFIEKSQRLEEGLAPIIDELAHGGEYFTFRLDDDDALTPDYLQMVATVWDRGYNVITPVEGYYIGVDRQTAGYPLRLVPAVNRGSPHGIGAFNAHIHALGKHNAIPGTVSIEGQVYWLRSVHRSNVTLAGRPGTAWGKKRTEHIDPVPALARYFPHLSLAAITEALRQSPV